MPNIYSLIKIILLSLLFSSTANAQSDNTCQINNDLKITPNIELTQVAQACNWEMIFSVSEYFSLEGLMNGLFDKLKSKIGAGICKIEAKDLWTMNEKLIGYKWPGDVLIDISKETDKELKDVLDVTMIPGDSQYKLGSQDIDALKMMLDIN